MAEQEQAMMKPLGELFDEISVRNLKNCGVEGLIPIEISVAELVAIAKSKGYFVDGVFLFHPI